VEPDDEPRLGHPLPRAADAYIDPDKLIHYSLDPNSPVGRHKARVFERVLAIGRKDWRYLYDQVLDALPDCPVTSVRPARRVEEDTTWGVVMPIRGLNGRQALVRTSWKLVRRRPELISAFVVKKRHQPPGIRSTI
jgi:hypothetical protein